MFVRPKHTHERKRREFILRHYCEKPNASIELFLICVEHIRPRRTSVCLRRASIIRINIVCFRQFRRIFSPFRWVTRLCLWSCAVCMCVYWRLTGNVYKNHNNNCDRQQQHQQRISESRHTSCGRQECARERTDLCMFAITFRWIVQFGPAIFLLRHWLTTCITVASSIGCPNTARFESQRQRENPNSCWHFVFPCRSLNDRFVFSCAPKRVKLTKRKYTYLPTIERRRRYRWKCWAPRQDGKCR